MTDPRALIVASWALATRTLLGRVKAFAVETTILDRLPGLRWRWTPAAVDRAVDIAAVIAAVSVVPAGAAVLAAAGAAAPLAAVGLAAAAVAVRSTYRAHHLRRQAERAAYGLEEQLVCAIAPLEVENDRLHAKLSYAPDPGELELLHDEIDHLRGQLENAHRDLASVRTWLRAVNQTFDRVELELHRQHDHATPEDKAGIGDLIGNITAARERLTHLAETNPGAVVNDLTGPRPLQTPRHQAGTDQKETHTMTTIHHHHTDDANQLLADILAVFAAKDEVLATGTVCDRLAAADPARYRGWEAEELAQNVRAAGICTDWLWDGHYDGRAIDRSGLEGIIAGPARQGCSLCRIHADPDVQLVVTEEGDQIRVHPSGTTVVIETTGSACGTAEATTTAILTTSEAQHMLDAFQSALAAATPETRT